MASRSYGQYCAFARALEVVGERWTMLVIRDLLVAPKRFTDLVQGLPGIPTNVLATRLKELEESGIVSRRALPPPDRSVVYEMTAYGHELEEAVDALGRWGAKALGNPRAGEVLTQDAMMTAMRATFHPEAARNVRATYEMRMGEIVFHLRIAQGKLTLKSGPSPDADLIVQTGPAIKMLLSGELTPRDAVAQGLLTITGGIARLEQFSRIFRFDEAG